MLLPVTDDGVRPIGPPDKCHFCGDPVGSHKSDCVCRTRTVVIRTAIEYTVAVPADWSPEEIEQYRKEHFCLSNDFEQLLDESVTGEGLCTICRRITDIQYVREADEHDMLPFLAGQKVREEQFAESEEVFVEPPATIN